MQLTLRSVGTVPKHSQRRSAKNTLILSKPRVSLSLSLYDLRHTVRVSVTSLQSNVYTANHREHRRKRKSIIIHTHKTRLRLSLMYYCKTIIILKHFFLEYKGCWSQKKGRFTFPSANKQLPRSIANASVSISTCLASLRCTYLGPFFLDPEEIRELGIGVVWNFAKGTGLL